MEGCAATTFAMGIDERGDFCIDLGIAQSLDDQFALPVFISRLCQRLHGAAATDGEMRAESRHAIRARADHINQLGALAINLGADEFAGQSVRHGEIHPFKTCEALAALAKPRDFEFRIEVET